MNRAIAVLLLGELLATGLASGQEAPQAPPPQQAASSIEVTARPEHAAAGTPVTIQGTVAVKGSNAVTITVKPPTGAPFSHTVPPDANGAFTLQYPDTKTAGIYSVQATMGASSAAATFGIGSTDIVQNAIQQVQDLLRTADSLVQEGKRQYDGNSALAGANRAATDQQFALLLDYIAQAKKLWTPSSPGSSSGPPTLADMLLEITAQVQARPDLGAGYAPALNQLQSWSEQSTTGLRRFKSREPLLKSLHSMNRQFGAMVTPVSFHIAGAEIAETAETSGGGTGTCETMQEAGEYLEMFGSIFSLLGTPFTVALNLLSQGIGSTEGAPTGIPVTAHGIMVAREMQEWKHSLDPKVGVATIGAHLAAKLANSMLHLMCNQFTGPFRVTMTAEAKIYGHTWWKFRVEMGGTLTLLFKQADWPHKVGYVHVAGTVPFTGEFEGQGTKFTVWEAAVPVLYKKVFQPGMTISWHKVQATRVTNFTRCTNCVVPLRSVAVASEEFGADPWATGGLPELPGAVTWGETPGTQEVGVSGQPTGIAISMLPGLKGLLSTPPFNTFSAAYFRIPVEGEIETYGNGGDYANHSGSVRLSVLPARNDWDPNLINAHARYLVVTSGLPLAVPLLLDFGLPYPSAEFIVKRALGNTTPGSITGDTRQASRRTEAEMAIDPSNTGNYSDFDWLKINFEHVNAMPETTVADGEDNKTGQATYSITLNLALDERPIAHAGP